MNCARVEITTKVSKNKYKINIQNQDFKIDSRIKYLKINFERAYTDT